MKNLSFLFEPMPASRLFLFRAAVAITTLSYGLRFGLQLENTLQSAFHTPMIAGIPFLSPAAGNMLILLHFFAGLCLLGGFLPRLSASFLLAAYLYTSLIDVRHYAHFSQFHMILLGILTLIKIPMKWQDLAQRKPTEISCPVWPVYFLRWQIAILLFYSALDKVFSPFWGLSGSFFAYELNFNIKKSGILFELWRDAASLCIQFPAAASAAAILSEFFAAASLLIKPLWKTGLIFNIAFVLFLEFLIRPSLFTWDLMAAFFLFLPIKKGGSMILILLIFTIFAFLRFQEGSFEALRILI